ncbi:hypothetical protein F5I97DRAFT_609999 [Phlebopus sp. FC_14]|nr:hypothetical protein F5I97DRAFT_609999 [Phlebopus sp. FC_14]
MSSDPGGGISIHRPGFPSDPSAPANTSTTVVPTQSFSSPPTSSSNAAIPSTVVITAPPPSTLSSSTSQAATTSSPSAGEIAGGVVGGVVGLLLLALGILLFLRARKRKRIAPSSEFMNSLQPGATPILRLDSGAEFTPASEKGGYHSQTVPPPFMQNSYNKSAALRDMKFPDAPDTPFARPSIERPLQPQRFSAQNANDSFAGPQLLSSSMGSRNEILSSDSELFPASSFDAHRPRSNAHERVPSRGSSQHESFLPNSYPALWQLAVSQRPESQDTHGEYPPDTRAQSPLRPLRREDPEEG